MIHVPTIPETIAAALFLGAFFFGLLIALLP